MLREADLPKVLSVEDAARYRHIFALQQNGRWQQADRDIAALSDRLLLGEVLAQRYLAKTYRAAYGELVDWLQHYGDEPDAKAIYDLAKKRHPAGAAAPPRPTTASTNANDNGDDLTPIPTPGALGARLQTLLPADAHRAEALKKQISALAASDPRRAEQLLASKDAKLLIDSDTRDDLRSAIAEGYLAQNEPQEALTASAETETAAYAPIANWNAGLAAWRLNRLDEARSHFQALARSPGQSPWVKSAAAFWAARVEMKAGRPENYGYWLRIAGESPRTFYGLLARHLLGIDRDPTFDSDPFTQFDAQLVDGIEAGKRILALISIGQDNLAASELRRLAAHSSPTLLQSLAALADRANLPGASLRLAGLLGDSEGNSREVASYPVPRWEPIGGFSVDRALLYALMRQESKFTPAARSHSGASGLMQLMPATAREMAKLTGAPLGPRNSKKEHAALNDPEYNLMLAQEYVKVLLGDAHINNNLILFAAAYNHGPAAAARWQEARPEYRDDPLLFIESIPSKQSRVFTQRVLTNYWIYRQRLGQKMPDLDALAAGKWPTYIAEDSATTQSAALEPGDGLNARQN
ncbi:MAG TPA: lytic transglycosylase domain-containing protein [Stellaceae bacterium]|nr:lytic transglycosylase domain-containing protein [Stellaceae bacterium]